MAGTTDPVVSAFARLCAHRFAGLSDAVHSVLTVLEPQLPPGRVIFGELNYDTDEYRVLDARGEGLDGLGAAARLPLRESFCVHMANDNAPALVGRASEDPVYAGLELHNSARVESYVAAPVELGDGTRVASVCAMSTAPDRYGESELALLTIAARLIAYEWEYVTREGQLRRLAQQQRALTGDPLTGLSRRHAFLEHLDREWHLTKRGVAESYLLTLKPLGIEEARATVGDAVADLLLQSFSEVISAVVRRSDVTGRLADDAFGVILVGCNGAEGAEAFRLRVEGALQRRLSHRPEEVELACGVERLGDADSPAAALERAEKVLGTEGVAQGAR
jgi:diguanylate cyclase (GGDEF)-like protein